MKRFFAILVLVFLVVVSVLALNLWIFVETPSGETPQEIRIERGTSLEKIIEELDRRAVISNIPLFKTYILVKRAASKIRAGEYDFPPGLKPREVLVLLMKGDFKTHRVTLPEGWTAREVATHLGGLGLVNPDLFLAKCADPAFIASLGLSVPHLEGYLFPDTYEIYKPKDEEEVIRKLVGRFQEVSAKEFETRTREVGLTLPEVMTVASLVEKETARPEERALIAAVFLRRLKEGMPLASDPAVIYGLPNFSGNLTHEDLQRPGPYNTYLNVGLPPTPIANPGAESIRAVLYPAETDFLYFVSKNDGTHHFSRTKEEHQAAVRRYQLTRP